MSSSSATSTTASTTTSGTSNSAADSTDNTAPVDLDPATAEFFGTLCGAFNAFGEYGPTLQSGEGLNTADPAAYKQGLLGAYTAVAAGFSAAAALLDQAPAPVIDRGDEYQAQVIAAFNAVSATVTEQMGTFAAADASTSEAVEKARENVSNAVAAKFSEVGTSLTEIEDGIDPATKDGIAQLPGCEDLF